MSYLIEKKDYEELMQKLAILQKHVGTLAEDAPTFRKDAILKYSNVLSSAVNILEKAKQNQELGKILDHYLLNVYTPEQHNVPQTDHHMSVLSACPKTP
jgi:hypothetical protein